MNLGPNLGNPGPNPNEWAGVNVGFYAPLKPPTHPVPSGDRLIARLLMKALRRSSHRVELMSRFRSWDGAGDVSRQERLRRAGGRLAGRLLARLRSRAAAERPRCWFTYHLYHKAPDWIGPPVCEGLRIPYIVAEASIASKRAGGRWDIGYAASVAAIEGAARIVSLNSTDVEGVRAVLGGSERLTVLPPFLDLSRFPGDGDGDAGPVRAGIARASGWGGSGWGANETWLVCVAMMRPGNKLDSYRVLARALHGLDDRAWRLIVIGDGKERPKVETAFASIPGRRVVFLGRREPREVQEVLAASDLFVWPAVNEPLGMAMLEAQACGLPVVAGRSRGVADIVQHGLTGWLVPPGDVDAFSDAVRMMLDDEGLRAKLRRAARCVVARDHDVNSAASALDAVLRAACESR